MTSLLATAAITLATTLLDPLPLPLPVLPPLGGDTTQAPHVSGTLDAPDGRLKRGCKHYTYTYAVDVPTDDWTFDITLRDRKGRGVNAQSLIGPNDDSAGVLAHRLCRWATVAGRFTLTGVLVSYDGDHETRTEVTETFRLRRRHR